MEEKIESSEFMTVDELAEMLKVDPRTIRRIVERKEISAVRASGGNGDSAAIGSMNGSRATR